jgi:hypothetical protein
VSGRKPSIEESLHTVPRGSTLTPANTMELIFHGGRRLVESSGVPGRTRRRNLARIGTSMHDEKRATRRRLLESLLASALPLKEIASRLGYSSTQTLARFVRSEFGTTATRLRESLRKT